MIALDKIQKTREYLDYLERHILNIEKAWKEVQEKCEDMKFVWDDYLYHWLDQEVLRHDESKLDKEEFTQYRTKFYPTNEELSELHMPSVDRDFNNAWANHKQENLHHWESLDGRKFWNVYESEVHYAHMVIDWLAMSYEFGDTPREYYEKNKEKINLPEWAVKFIYEIFERLEK